MGSSFIHLIRTDSNEKDTRSERDTCTPMFIAALFVIARTWKQPRCPSADEWTMQISISESCTHHPCSAHGTKTGPKRLVPGPWVWFSSAKENPGNLLPSSLYSKLRKTRQPDRLLAFFTRQSLQYMPAHTHVHACTNTHTHTRSQEHAGPHFPWASYVPQCGTKIKGKMYQIC